MALPVSGKLTSNNLMRYPKLELSQPIPGREDQSCDLTTGQQMSRESVCLSVCLHAPSVSYLPPCCDKLSDKKRPNRMRAYLCSQIQKIQPSMGKWGWGSWLQ